MSPEDLAAFNQAVALAQAGNKQAAYPLLITLLSHNPANKDVLLWLAFTTGSLQEAERAIYDAGRANPNDPAVGSARDWLAQERLKQWRQQPLPTLQTSQEVNYPILGFVGYYFLWLIICILVLAASIAIPYNKVEDVRRTAVNEIDNSLSIDRMERISDKAKSEIGLWQAVGYGLPLLIVVGSAVWVLDDVNKNKYGNVSATVWFFGCFLLWPFVLPYYLTMRHYHVLHKLGLKKR